jgi:hypothetical protein
VAASLPLTGILPLARSTFDVEFAQEKLAAMLSALGDAGIPLAGPRRLLFDADATLAAMAELGAAKPEHVLVLQVTFTDAAMTCEIASAFDRPLSIWAIPEPRTGGRLRLNSFCGLNLASHALGLRGRPFSWLYAAPDSPRLGEGLNDLVGLRRLAGPLPLSGNNQVAAGPGAEAARRLGGMRIGRIGEHPGGFDTCAYDAGTLRRLAGVEVEELALADLFGRANSVEDSDVAKSWTLAAQTLAGLEAVDRTQLDRSLRLKNALDEIRHERRIDAFAIRCWPETFTEYGGAVCGPVSMIGEARTPCACEADVYGALTSRLLQEIADAPVFLVDLVDVDENDDTAVAWHCGQAPISMRDPDIAARATIHTNRKMPLLYQFPLKPGRVTFGRISQAQGRPRMVIAGAEMLKRPMAFTGTSGVLRFDASAHAVLDRIMRSGLEHHMALAYGDHRTALKQAAAALDLPVLELA